MAVHSWIRRLTSGSLASQWVNIAVKKFILAQIQDAPVLRMLPLARHSAPLFVLLLDSTPCFLLFGLAAG